MRRMDGIEGELRIEICGKFGGGEVEEK